MQQRSSRSIRRKRCTARGSTSGSAPAYARASASGTARDSSARSTCNSTQPKAVRARGGSEGDHACYRLPGSCCGTLPAMVQLHSTEARCDPHCVLLPVPCRACTKLQRTLLPTSAMMRPGLATFCRSSHTHLQGAGRRSQASQGSRPTGGESSAARVQSWEQPQPDAPRNCMAHTLHSLSSSAKALRF